MLTENHIKLTLAELNRLADFLKDKLSFVGLQRFELAKKLNFRMVAPLILLQVDSMFKLGELWVSQANLAQ